MTTWTAITTLPGASAASALGEALEALDPTGVGVFEVEDGSGLWEVAGYFGDRPDIAGLALLSALHGARDFAVSELPDTDWVAQVRRELRPIEAGRFYLYGSHDADGVPPDRVALLIEAAMAFGTGHHGSTQGCLLAFDRLLAEGTVPASVADVGCGTAVLAMAAAKVGAATVIAGDIDQTATDTARANAVANGLPGLDIVTAPGFGHTRFSVVAPFDLIFANILKDPLIKLAPDVATHLAASGAVILSGILHRQTGDVLSAYAQQGLVERARQEVGDWTTLTLVRGKGL